MTEATLRLAILAISLPIIREIVVDHIYPIYKRIEDRSRAKSEAKLEAIIQRMNSHG